MDAHSHAAFLIEIARSSPPCGGRHPLRLGLGLSWSVYLYEVCGRAEEACELAKETYAEAIAGMDGVDDSGYKDAVLCIQMLRENLTRWTEPG